MSFRSLGLTLPLPAAADAFFPIRLRLFIFGGLDLFSSKTASNEVPCASRAVYDLKRQKLVCAISRRPSANQKCQIYERKGFGADLQQIKRVGAMS